MNTGGVTDDDLALIRRAIELFNRMLDPDADVDEMRRLWVDEPEIVPLRAALEGNVYAGPDAIDRFREASSETWSELEIAVDEISRPGPHYLVSVSWRGRGRESGAEITAPLWFVISIRDGRIARAATHVARETALAEAQRPS